MIFGRRKSVLVKYSSTRRPFLISAINRLGSLLQKINVFPEKLNAEFILKEAEKRTGLKHSFNSGFLERLDLLVKTIESEADLHPLGRLICRQNLLRIVMIRLKLDDEFQKKSSVLKHEIDDPVFIIGLQRTGTTLLHRVLATDSRFRFLPSWEAVNPVPVVEDEKEDIKKRVKSALMAERALKYMAPEFFAIHPVEALSPEEDVLLLEYDLFSTVPEATMWIPSYSAWLEKQDHSEGYIYYKKILQYLHWQRASGRWLLKSPHHLEHLSEILKIFPQAKIIMPHRDPLKVVPSFCSMMAHAYGIFSDNVDAHKVGKHWLSKMAKMVLKAIEERGKTDGSNFIDVHYKNLVSNPLIEFEKIYDFLGLEMEAERKNVIKSWLEKNPQHKYGKHIYRLEDFGLSGQDVRNAFEKYYNAFSIFRED